MRGARVKYEYQAGQDAGWGEIYMHCNEVHVGRAVARCTITCQFDGQSLERFDGVDALVLADGRADSTSIYGDLSYLYQFKHVLQT
jgi:hypothetical protein